MKKEYTFKLIKLRDGIFSFKYQGLERGVLYLNEPFNEKDMILDKMVLIRN